MKYDCKKWTPIGEADKLQGSANSKTRYVREAKVVLEIFRLRLSLEISKNQAKNMESSENPAVLMKNRIYQ